jgi:hypothetical protein
MEAYILGGVRIRLFSTGLFPQRLREITEQEKGDTCLKLSPFPGRETPLAV